jgi:putative transcriptional regulator
VGKPTRVTNRITEFRQQAGLSQADLAERIGVTRQTVNAIERGKYSPSLEAAFRIARVVQRPLEDVFDYPEAW